MVGRFSILILFVAGALATLRPPAAASVEPGIFMEYTLYSKDNLHPSAYGKNVIVVFHGLFSAMPNGYYKKFHKELKDSFTVVGFNYDYFDVQRNIAEFGAFYDQYLADKNLIFTGTSLGAFWADFFGTRFGARKIVLSNPIIDPADVLMRFVGEHYSERRRKPVVVTAEKVAAYDAVRLGHPFSGRRLVILTADDDVLDHRLAREHFETAPKTTTVVFGSGGHSIRYREGHPAWHDIEAFVRDAR